MSEWIKMSDQMPTLYKDVLLYKKDTPNQHIQIGQLIYAKVASPNNIYIQLDYGAIAQLCHYTHWMPLPEPPID